MTSPTLPDSICLRPPGKEDGAALHGLVKSCPPLDLNSPYVYFLVADHFGQTSIVAEQDHALVGMLSAFRHPARPDVLFVWQVAVSTSCRGMRLATHMLNAVVDLPACKEVTHLETTIGPTNTASRRLFNSWADHHKIEVNVTPYLEPTDFPSEGKTTHDAEDLFRIRALFFSPGS